MKPEVLAEQILPGLALPAWVERAEVQRFIDHSGEDALRVTFHVRPGEDRVLDQGDELNALGLKVHLALRDGGVDLWPYTTFDVGESDDPAGAANVCR